MIFGAGYVGCSLGVLFAKKYEVTLIDVDVIKVNKINQKKSPINEPMLQEYLSSKELNLKASTDYKKNINTIDLVILALPTNFNIKTNSFDTSVIKSVLAKLNKIDLQASIVIKSTVPIGFTKSMQRKYPKLNICFIPEFLREGHAIEDNINPSRIVIGEFKKKSNEIEDVFLKITKNSPKVFCMQSTEAEAVKLFSNSYLAARISFFNEVDSLAAEKKLNSKNIIDAIASDPRIGDGYNNPSFGYGGYCLPKDIKQLSHDFKNIPHSIVSSVIKSNHLRKEFIAKMILKTDPMKVGIFRLTMKKGSNNFRESAIFDVMELIAKAGKDILVYEPLLPLNYDAYQITHDLVHFKKVSDIIVANRSDESLKDVKNKLFTRDLYGKD